MQNKKTHISYSELKDWAHCPHYHKKNWIVGVFIPTCENMWGVLIFLRFFEIVGHAGVVMSLVAVFISFLAAIVTRAVLMTLGEAKVVGCRYQQTWNGSLSAV